MVAPKQRVVTGGAFNAASSFGRKACPLIPEGALLKPKDKATAPDPAGDDGKKAEQPDKKAKDVGKSTGTTRRPKAKAKSGSKDKVKPKAKARGSKDKVKPKAKARDRTKKGADTLPTTADRTKTGDAPQVPTKKPAGAVLKRPAAKSADPGAQEPRP